MRRKYSSITTKNDELINKNTVGACMPLLVYLTIVKAKPTKFSIEKLQATVTRIPDIFDVEIKSETFMNTFRSRNKKDTEA